MTVTDVRTSQYLSGNFAPVREEVDVRRPPGHGRDPDRPRRSPAADRSEPGRRSRSRHLPLVHRQRHGPRTVAARRARRHLPQPLRALRLGGRGAGWTGHARAPPRHGRQHREHQRHRARRHHLRDRRGRRPADAAHRRARDRGAAPTSAARSRDRSPPTRTRTRPRASCTPSSYYWEWDHHLQYVVVGVDGTVRRTVDVPVPGSPMVHDCAITESRVVVFDLPVTFNLEARDGRRDAPLPVEPRVRRARRAARRARRDADSTVWCELDDLCYVYHPLNAYDDGDKVVMDVAVHPKMFATDTQRAERGGPHVRALDDGPRDRGASDATLISDIPQEFPRGDERLTGRKHRYGFGATFRLRGRPARARRHHQARPAGRDLRRSTTSAAGAARRSRCSCRSRTTRPRTRAGSWPTCTTRTATRPTS